MTTTAARPSLGQALLFIPIAAAAAYPGYFAAAILIAGVAAGTEDVALPGVVVGGPQALASPLGVALYLLLLALWRLTGRQRRRRSDPGSAEGRIADSR